MGRIYALGETLYEKIYREGTFLKSIAGGSAVNTAISLGRMKLPVYLISEFGNDEEGNKLFDFFLENKVNTRYVYRHNDGKTSVSNALLDANNEAQYQFFKDLPKKRFEIEMPNFKDDDILLLGSWFAINPELKNKVLRILKHAHNAHSLIIYDPNFRVAHINELKQIKPTILRNMKYADIVRGSNDDFLNIFGAKSAKETFSYMPDESTCLIYTTSNRGEFLHCKIFQNNYPIPEINPVSTIGAGDNFNAGLIYGLSHKGISKKDLPYMDKKDWKDLINYGILFASEVCMLEDNYISPDFAREIKLK
ncbi:MAG: carbohydrate kinase [Bacteroidetes bacterium]|nr:MAG: carbohydrate kinase [Bacteroidota bacterium]